MSTPDPPGQVVVPAIDPQWLALFRAAETLPDGPDRDAAVEAMHARYLQVTPYGTTPGGLPYPAPTDPVAQGADAIRALAEAVEAKSAARLDQVHLRAVTVYPTTGSDGSFTVTFPALPVAAAGYLFEFQQGGGTYGTSLNAANTTTLFLVLWKSDGTRPANLGPFRCGVTVWCYA